MSETDERKLVELTTEIVSSFVTKNPIPVASLPDLIKSVHATLADLDTSGRKPAPRPEPAVPVSKSITPDYLICLEDGRKLKMLKRYLRSRYDMTPEEYRARWNLPADYPMVAPNYAKIRSEKAKEIGLGRKTGTQG
ncbi:MAG: transcriptional regulator [Alphaproteobacteria bacterium]|jgi:predicted transcriptional regulator|nr:transcriptional regulator [Alphaproteobacteria bacterium]